MMIDPILYTIKLGAIQIPIRWYGLLIVAGAMAGAWYAAWYVKRKDEDPDMVWDAMIWLLISGILGARLWYVIADMIGGNTRYLDAPGQIFRVWEGGLNILGGIVVAAVVGWYYTKRNNIDFWLLADAVGPGLLIGQAVGRWGNFINQELYGPPTTLPWGISIDAAHRIAPWHDLTQFPLDVTRFHPTFAYEMIWNLIFAAILAWVVIKIGSKLNPGVIFGSWLIIAGVGRVWIELFRPDQPRFFGTPVSTSTIVSAIFALIGVFIVMVKLGKINVPFMSATSAAKKGSVRRPARQKARH